MCIIVGSEKVADTQILAFQTSDKKSQITCYSNRVEIKGSHDMGHYMLLPQPIPQKTNAAMILPIPRGNESFQMIDTTGCENMFEKIEDCFPKPLSYTNSLSTAKARGFHKQALQVKSCGSYKYSLAPTLSDFDRIDDSVFKLDPDVANLLKEHYNNDFAFLVCKLEKSMKFHPVAYMHPMPRDAKLFVPCRHYHQGHQHPQGADWDHNIYIIGNNQIGEGASSTADLSALSCFRQHLPNTSPAYLRKLDVHGLYENNDLRIPVCA